MYKSFEEKSFLQWMRSTNQIFTGNEYHFRLGIYLQNKRLVQQHNANMATFAVALNHLAHLTPSEYKSMLGFKMNKGKSAVSSFAATANKVYSASAAATVDWRTKGIVNKIQDQGQCGSCWAFSAVQAAESAYARSTGNLLKFSEQNLVDCVTICYGCSGGLMDYAYYYIIKNQGGSFNSGTDYPYVGYDQSCSFNKNRAIGKISNFIYVTEGSESDLALKVSQYGPVAVAIDASNWSFQLYSSGIYDESSCSSEDLDHGVGCVGYGSENSVNYWIIRNSWGTSWGEQGYIRMVKDKNNQCGEASMACVPIV